MEFFDLELIDVNEDVENFTYSKVTKKDLDKIIEDLKENQTFLEFNSAEGMALLERKYFRGIMYIPHQVKPKTVAQETMESAEILGRVPSLKSKIKPKVAVSLKQSPKPTRK